MIDVFVVVATRSARGSALVPYDSNVISKCGCIGETLMSKLVRQSRGKFCILKGENGLVRPTSRPNRSYSSVLTGRKAARFSTSPFSMQNPVETKRRTPV